jgi:hypothetical protein
MVEKSGLVLDDRALWWVQRAIRIDGIPDGGLFVASADDARKKLAGYVRAIVSEQLSYHERNHHRLHAVEHKIHNFSLTLFASTAISVVAHFFIHASWLLIFTAFLPALAAAMHGLSTKLEIGRLAAQSKQTLSELRVVARAIDEATEHSGWSGWLRLRELTLEAARIMSDENGQWRQLIRHQGTEIPA